MGQQIHAAAIGQAKIEDDGSDLVHVGPCLAFFAAARDIDGKSRRAQPVGQARCQLFVVFDKQKSQLAKPHPFVASTPWRGNGPMSGSHETDNMGRN
ncbi:hypothetical protein GCM10010990_16070 [Croceicoccus mobilis]|uniref:Uncharacterized protein n=1 Tax=Croceicoccus mobilis TaxID=1703339 RepID=A0A916YYR5_9SPHN|nr:hypothetical protein GCM10010990_16070 [Croceicoccus mobilis]